MLNLTTALGRNGFQDWILQRVSAVMIGLYTIFLLGFWFVRGSTYADWQTLFSLSFFCYLTVAVLLATLVHAWIGLWVICTDYVKAPGYRLALFICIYCVLL